MPSFTSIINSLLRSFPSEKASQVFRTAQKLHPQSEPLANSHLTRALLDEQLHGWLTRHAWEACRAWNWPYWINAQSHAGSPAFTNFVPDTLLKNTAARDAAPIPGLPDTFAGTVDRRGMVTPPHGRFSVEAWFRFPDGLTVPAAILDDAQLTIQSTATNVVFEITTAYGQATIEVHASGTDDLKSVRIIATCEPLEGSDSCPASIYFAIRPYSLEGITPIHDLVYNSKGFWMADSQVIAWYPHRPDVSWASDARHGDAVFFLSDPPERTAVRCPAGMANALTGWHLPLRESSSLSAEIILPLHPISAKTFPFVELVKDASRRSHTTARASESIASAESNHAIVLQTGSSLDQMLIMADAQLRSLTDISEPAVHQRFLHKSNWLVAAVRGLLYQGRRDAAARLLQLPLIDIQKNGNLNLAAGKWSLHGQVLTAVADYHRLSQAPPERPVVSYSQLRNIARWIMRKRREVAHAPDKPQGLFPPGATRSNTGIEYQLVDNFWALQGLVSAGWLARFNHEHRDAEVLQKESAKFAANLAAAMHRELEYSLSQQMPGRLHRAFDPNTAAEILEIALMPDTYRLLKAESWLPRLVDFLIEPLPASGAPQAGFVLRRIDEQGVYASRRMLLCLALLRVSDKRLPSLFAEVLQMQTPLLSWTECLNPRTMMGTGREMVDTEATALFTVLIRQMLLQDDDNTIMLSPALALNGSETGSVIFNNAPTIHGLLTAEWSSNAHGSTLALDAVSDDPTVEVFWKQDDESRLLGSGSQTAGTYSHKLTAFTNNPGR